MKLDAPFEHKWHKFDAEEILSHFVEEQGGFRRAVTNVILTISVFMMIAMIRVAVQELDKCEENAFSDQHSLCLFVLDEEIKKNKGYINVFVTLLMRFISKVSRL